MTALEWTFDSIPLRMFTVKVQKFSRQIKNFQDPKNYFPPGNQHFVTMFGKFLLERPKKNLDPKIRILFISSNF